MTLCHRAPDTVKGLVATPIEQLGRRLVAAPAPLAAHREAIRTRVIEQVGQRGFPFSKSKLSVFSSIFRLLERQLARLFARLIGRRSQVRLDRGRSAV